MKKWACSDPCKFFISTLETAKNASQLIFTGSMNFGSSSDFLGFHNNMQARYTLLIKLVCRRTQRWACSQAIEGQVINTIYGYLYEQARRTKAPVIWSQVPKTSLPPSQLRSLYMRKSCPACQGYPACRGEITRPPELSCPPRWVNNPNVNSKLILQRNKLKVTSARVTRGKGCLRYPRPYKWGLNPVLWSATWAIKNWHHLACSGSKAVSHKKNFPEAKVQGDQSSHKHILVHKHTQKNNLAIYPANLISLII